MWIWYHVEYSGYSVRKPFFFLSFIELQYDYKFEFGCGTGFNIYELELIKEIFKEKHTFIRIISEKIAE